jgi:ParB family chromosome partitioning protein
MHDMSIKDRLERKTQGLIPPVKGEAGLLGGGGSAGPMRTGPGQMLMVNSLMKESNERVAVLEERLKQFDGALPAMLIDPTRIDLSKWANRIDASFSTAAFEALKAEITDTGGNVQPIKVRPSGVVPDRFEIIFGHRRHRACLELGLPVLAVVESVTDAELFKQMDRENRARENLSPWEQGMMYRQALQDRLFVSRDQLAREIGVDPGNLSKALRLADLDEAVVKAFDSPLDLQYRWAKPLADALLHDRARVMQVIEALAAAPLAVKRPKDVFDRLVGASALELRVEQVRVGKRVVAELQADGDKVTVRFALGAVNAAAYDRLRNFLEAELFGN